MGEIGETGDREDALSSWGRESCVRGMYISPIIHFFSYSSQVRAHSSVVVLEDVKCVVYVGAPRIHIEDCS